jgi:hypothetical protein
MGLKTGRELGMFRRHWEAYPIDLIDEHKLPTGDTSFIPPSCRPEIKPVLGLGKFHRTVLIEMNDNVTPVRVLSRRYPIALHSRIYKIIMNMVARDVTVLRQ